MLSFKARMVKLMLRNAHLFQLKLRRDIVDWTKKEAILSFREQVEKGAERFGSLPEEIKIEGVDIEGLYAEWLLPEGAEKDKVILYFHGGGYVSGTCRSHRSITAKFVKETGLATLLFEYRLAPENPFPAALEDALKAYQYLLDKEIEAEDIVFLGDSAGGGLCLATLLALRDKGIPLPAAACAYSPVTDFLCTGNSHQTKRKICLSPEGMAEALGKHYAGEEDLDLPYISPLYGELDGLPPLLLYAGGEETLLDDAVMFTEKAKAEGADIRLVIGEGLFHCYPATAPMFPEATAALEDICRFLCNKMN